MEGCQRSYDFAEVCMFTYMIVMLLWKIILQKCFLKRWLFLKQFLKRLKFEKPCIYNKKCNPYRQFLYRIWSVKTIPEKDKVCRNTMYIYIYAYYITKNKYMEDLAYTKISLAKYIRINTIFQNIFLFGLHWKDKHIEQIFVAQWKFTQN